MTVQPPTTTARKFRAANMTDALKVVQAELGPEALIVSVRQAPAGPAWQVWRKPGVEVVALASTAAAAVSEPRPQPEPAEAPVLKPPAPAKRQAAREAAPAGRSDFAWPAPARAEAPRPPAASTRPPEAAPASRLERSAPAAWPAPLNELRVHLADQGVDAGLAQSVLKTCAETLSPRALDEPARVREHVQRQLEAQLRMWGSHALAAASRPGGGPRVVGLVGPSGAGKTTMTAKLAAHHARTLGLRVAWICADTHRAGAIAQARIYAESLRLPLRVAYTGDEAAQAAAAEKDTDLILVDTPGVNPRREADLVELGELLTALPGRATYLVAPATAKGEDLADAASAFSVLDLKGLLMTKLDETATFGGLYNLAWRSRLPILFYSAGPRVLDGLRPATAAPLVRALLTADPAAFFNESA